MRRNRTSPLTRILLANGKLLLATVVLLMPAPACADYYLGVKTGYLSVDAPKKSNPRNLALGLGVDIDNNRIDLRLVGEINHSISDGEARGGDDLSFESQGLYLATRTSHALFTVFRAGLVANRIESGGDTNRNEGLAVGIGFGVVSGRASMLIEYTDLAGDASFLTFGLEF